jgi:hypothetical protein
MTRNIVKRIQKLESRIPPQLTDEQERTNFVSLFITLAIAHYLGDPLPNESVMDAYSRALGYACLSECFEAMRTEDLNFYERDRLARMRLFAKFSVSPRDKWAAVCEAFERMANGLSERYREVMPELAVAHLPQDRASRGKRCQRARVNLAYLRGVTDDQAG